MSNPRRSLLMAMLLFVVASLPFSAVEAQTRIAVASNFRAAAEELTSHLAKTSGYEIECVFGASGKHYAQIVHGAPFSAFLSADRTRPQKLLDDGQAVQGSGIVYALGRLIMWSPQADLQLHNGQWLLSNNEKLAIANPRLAPYGLAAKQTLESLGLYQIMSERLVQGENISQAMQFVLTGSVRAGLVAQSQLVALRAEQAGSHWPVPAELHDPIEQMAVVIKPGPETQALMELVRSEAGRRIISSHGYGLPDF